MKKRLLSAFLALVLVLTLAPMAAFAATNSFADVKTDAWYYNAVSYVNDKGDVPTSFVTCWTVICPR